MKRTLVKIVMLVALMCVGAAGCGSGTMSFLGGAATGGALSNTFAGVQADLETEKQKKLEELESANQELENATDEVEKLAAAAKVKALEQKVRNLSDLQAGVGLTEQGLKVDWKDPAAVGGYGATAITTLLAIYFRRKQSREAKKRSAEKVGRDKTINELESLPESDVTAPLVKKLLFNNIGEQRSNQKVA